LLSDIIFKVAGIVPPFGTIAGVRPVIGWKFKLAGPVNR